MLHHLPLWQRLATLGGSALLMLTAIGTLVSGEPVTLSAPLYFLCTTMFVFVSLCDADKQNVRLRSEERALCFLATLNSENRAATDPKDRAYYRGGGNALAVFLTIDGQIPASKLAEVNMPDEEGES